MEYFLCVEDLRAAVVDGLLSLLRDRHAGAILAASTVLGFLATDGTSMLFLLERTL